METSSSMRVIGTTGIFGCCARAASGQAGRRTAEQRDELAPHHIEHGLPPRFEPTATSRGDSQSGS
jgi:hypothetical protein